MALFTVQRNGYTTAVKMIGDIVADMVNNGFTVVYPTTYNIATVLTAPTKIILEAGVDVDPLAASQPWRVCFDVKSDDGVAMYIATPLQLKNDGTVSTVNSSAGSPLFYAGATGTQMTNGQALNSADPSTGFINRTQRIGTDGKAFPLNYRMTISDHGIFIGCYEGNWASGIFQTAINSYFNWVLIQRPVNKTTGLPLTTGKCPVFCVNKVDSKYWRFIVRESDIPHPTNPVTATEHSEDCFRIINNQNQISLTEDKKYLVSFMHNLNTPRFRYTEELDMVGIVSSDVIMDTVPTQMTVYGGTRVYTAMPGSSAFNTGVKLLALTSIQ